ncbi:MAG: TolC family protein [Desulfovibrio sp.]|jgi:outer membrane protein|nr:TolC family protein [Desulfovibrio sp.]
MPKRLLLRHVLAFLVPLALAALSGPYPGVTLAASKKQSPAPLYKGERPLDPQSERHGRPLSLTMDESVRRALQFNPSLGARESQSRSSEEGRKAARGAFGPRLGMSYTAVKQEKETSPVSAKPPEMGMYSFGVEISQPVFQGFKLLANYQKNALQADSDKAALRKAELDMTEQVQRYFLDYLRREENVVSERDSLARLREQLNITKAFYDVGLRPRLDVLQAEVNVSQAENLFVQAENGRDTCLAMLNTLLGLPATAKTAYTGKLVHIPFKLSLEQCLELAYRQRPDLYLAAKAVEIAAKEQLAVRSGYYPQVEAYYNITNTGNSPDTRYADERGSRGTTWEVGARATWNVFQWGTTWYADSQAGWLVTKLRYEEENLKLGVGYDVKSKLLAVREAEKRIALAEKSAEQATEAFHAALARYREQVGTNFEVLDASTKLTTAQASLTGAKADYLTALAQIYVAMGEFRPDLLRARQTGTVTP